MTHVVFFAMDFPIQLLFYFSNEALLSVACCKCKILIAQFHIRIYAKLNARGKHKQCIVSICMYVCVWQWLYNLLQRIYVLMQRFSSLSSICSYICGILVHIYISICVFYVSFAKEPKSTTIPFSEYSQQVITNMKLLRLLFELCLILSIHKIISLEPVGKIVHLLVNIVKRKRQWEMSDLKNYN